MSDTTAIEWCDSTFNPWIGCTRVSPGCDGCYAAVSTPARAMRIGWGPGQPRHRTTSGNWARAKRWNAEHDAFHATHGRRQRVFCASLADVFDNAAPLEWRDDLWRLIEATPNLDWLLLTKRVGNVEHMVWPRWMQAEFPANVWLGITVVNQAEADRDIPKLLRVPARVRFLSMEPLLGPVDLTRIVLHSGPIELATTAPPEWLGIKQVNIVTDATRPDKKSGRRIDWVIVGGESGPGARPMHPDWARSLRDQCAAAGVPFLFKQWGEWTPGENVERVRGTVDTAFLHDDGWHVYPLNLATDHGHIDDQPDLYRVGKKAAGRHLDGCTHDGFPEP